MVLKEWYQVRHVFKKPKVRVFFGFWSTPKLLWKLYDWLLIKECNNSDKWWYKTLYRICNYITAHINPCLPVWRRGNTFRILKKYNHYVYNTNNVGYAWNDDFKPKLEKYHLSWLKPQYELPIWMCIYFFNNDVFWKRKYDDIAYEFPPQLTIVLFNISLSLHWHSPIDDGDCLNDDNYWTTLLSYSHDTDNKKPVIDRVDDLCHRLGFWRGEKTVNGKKEKYRTWVVNHGYFKDTIVESVVKDTINKLDSIESKKVFDLTCPKCGSKVILDKDIVLTTYPVQYQYTCPKCGEKKYLIDKYENEY